MFRQSLAGNWRRYCPCRRHIRRTPICQTAGPPAAEAPRQQKRPVTARLRVEQISRVGDSYWARRAPNSSRNAALVISLISCYVKQPKNRRWSWPQPPLRRHHARRSSGGRRVVAVSPPFTPSPRSSRTRSRSNGGCCPRKPRRSIGNSTWTACFAPGALYTSDSQFKSRTSLTLDQH
jgi:hypothetical protein